MVGQSLEVMISQTQLARRIQELAADINRDYHAQTLTVISVLKGAFIFTADLVRQLQMPVQLEFIGVASYVGTSSSGHVRITHDLTADVQGKHILLVEDIVDSGKTIDYLLDTLAVREPASLKVCALLSKPHVHAMRHPIDYVGFEIGDEFVVGYGLDFDGAYRQLPYLAHLKA